MNRQILLITLVIATMHLNAQEIELSRGAPLRQDPASTSERLDALKAGDKLTLLANDQTNRYFHVSHNNIPGWVHSSHIAKTTTAKEAAPKTVKIASFNVLHLGWGQSKDLKLLAGLIAEYDLCALIEVMENPPEQELANALNTITKERTGQQATWKITTSELVGKTTYKERYAFAFRTDRVQQIEPGQFIDDDNDTYDRDPYYATFKAGNFDFTLIAVHITFGKKTADRKQEIHNLRNVFEQVQSSNGTEQDVILVGDFNLPADHNYWKNLTNQTSMAGTTTHTQIINLIPSTTKTSISTKDYASSYDNIWIDTTHTSHEYTGHANANQFVETLFPDEDQPFQKAREITSDHVPVSAEFYTTKPDDD